MRRLGFFIFSLLWAASALASEISISESVLATSNAKSKKPRPIEFGNVLTSTGHVLGEGRASAGFQIAAVGLTDRTTLGTSPWLWTSYNMQNLYVRHRIWESGGRRLAGQVGLFKTYGPRSESGDFMDPSLGYKMQSTWATAIWSTKQNSNFDFHVNASLANYSDDERPFSLRRPTSTSPIDVNVSSLFEVSLGEGLHLLGEIGGIGLNQKLWQVHTGAALDFRTDSWLFKIGYSMTGTPQAFFSPARRTDMAYKNRQVDGITPLGEPEPMEDPSYRKTLEYDFSVHPEFTFQYFF